MYVCIFVCSHNLIAGRCQQAVNNSLIGVNQNCLSALGRGNPLCFFPEMSLAYMVTPLFVLQSGYDSWQVQWFVVDVFLRGLCVRAAVRCVPTHPEDIAMPDSERLCIPDVTQMTSCATTLAAKYLAQYHQYQTRAHPQIDTFQAGTFDLHNRISYCECNACC